MGTFSKWSDTLDTGKLRVTLFVSRNKDNKDVENFKERRYSFLTTKSDEDLAQEFQDFVNRGVENEFSRLYVSVNERDNEKVKENFLRFLLDQCLLKTDLNAAALPTKLAAIAARKENAKTKKWLLDFDEDESKLEEFIKDMVNAAHKHGNTAEFSYEVHKTPNGYGIVTSRGFDTSEFCVKYGNVVKKDDLLCIKYARK